MQGYCDIFVWIILKRMSTEAHVYMRRHQDAKVEHFDVSDVINLKFLHGGVSYTLNGENDNIMLEFMLNSKCSATHSPEIMVRVKTCLVSLRNIL